MVIELKFAALGDAEVGKTSLLMVLNGQPFPEDYSPTISQTYSQDGDILGVPYKLSIWDTGGRTEYAQLLSIAYSGVDVILLCFALDSKQSFANLTDRWIGEVRDNSPNAKIILIGTKKDLRQEGNTNHVTDDEARGFVSEQKWDAFIPCSPKSGEGVDEVFPAAVKACNAKKKSGG
jgi:small GTP-binding protein